MSKRAEEAALKAYPFIPLPQYDLRDENPTDGNKIHRRIFLEGYEQAEKELELTWQDMMLLRILFDATDANQSMGALTVQPMTREYYEYLLQEFNRQRKK